MTVLKDAASTALYGARGANGIIMITTKKGTGGKARINFDAKWGVNSRAIKNYDVMTSPKNILKQLTKLFTILRFLKDFLPKQPISKLIPFCQPKLPAV